MTVKPTSDMSQSRNRDAVDEKNRLINPRRSPDLFINQQKFSANLIHQSPNPIVVFNSDRSIAFVNRAFEKLTGFTSDSVSGLHVPYPWWPENDITKNKIEFNQIFDRREYRYEKQFRKKDGTLFWVEITSGPVTDNGVRVYHISIWGDLTERKQVETALIQSEKRYRKLAEECPISIMTFDREGCVTFVNQWHLKTFARNRRDRDFFIGKKITELPGIVKAGVASQLEGVFHGESVILEDIFFPEFTGGHLGYQSIKAVPFYDNGSVSGGILIREDVTERHLKQSQIENHNQSLKKILDSTPNILMLVDLELRVIMMNRKGIDFSDSGKQDPTGFLAGRALRCFNDWTGKGCGLSAECSECPLRTRVQNTFLTGLSHREEEARMTFRKGDSNAARVIDLMISTTLMEMEGQASVLVSLSDITERNRSREALIDSEEKFRSIMESQKDPTYICSSEYLIEYMNPAMIALVGRDATGEFCYHAIYDKDQPCAWCTHPDVMNGKSVNAEINMDRIDTVYDVGSSPLRHADGSLSQLTVFRDITEKKKMTDRLQQAQKMESIGNLAGGIAHDFNNLLFPILGMAEMLLEDLPAGSPEYEKAGEILKAGKRGSELVRQILSFSRQDKHQKMPIQVQKILKEVVKLSRATIPATITIFQEIQSECPMISADPAKMHQIAMNLITNAYHAVEPGGGSITIRLSETDLSGSNRLHGALKQGRHVVFSVSDTGTGIPPAIIDKVFDPYFTTKEKGKGTGLGLAMVYGMVKEFDGDILLRSTVGKGTTIELFFPAITTHEKRINGPDSVGLPGGKETILLVDDEVPVVRLVKQILERLGYKVHERTSSIEALQAFKAHPERFDLVITDMTMPNMDGAEFSKAVLAQRPDIPIILCTGFSETINDSIARQIGIRSILLKPVVKAELAGAVRSILDGKGSEGETRA